MVNMNDQQFFILFAKGVTFISYLMFLALFLTISAALIFEPPIWLMSVPGFHSEWLVLSILTAFTFINLMFVPICVMLAKYDGMERYRRDLNAHKSEEYQLRFIESQKE